MKFRPGESTESLGSEETSADSGTAVEGAATPQATPTPGPTEPRQAIRDWFRDHIANSSPVARNVDCYTHVLESLPALEDLIRASEKE